MINFMLNKDTLKKSNTMNQTFFQDREINDES